MSATSSSKGRGQGRGSGFEINAKVRVLLPTSPTELLDIDLDRRERRGRGAPGGVDLGGHEDGGAVAEPALDGVLDRGADLGLVPTTGNGRMFARPE